MNDRLAEANASYAAKDFLRAFALCQEVLDAQPDCVEALVLFAQLCLIAGEYLSAVQCLRLAEHIDPEHAAARALLTEDVANEGYREVLKIDPALENHTSAYVFAAAVPQAQRLEAMLREIIALRPALAAAHASLGNLLGRTGRLGEGLDEYARALAIDPRAAAVRLGYAERSRLSGQEHHAREQFAHALDGLSTYEELPAGEEQLRLLALCAPDFWENNVLVDMLIDREHVHLTKYFVGGNGFQVGADQPVFCAIADPLNHEAIAAASRFLQQTGARALNDPSLLKRTERTFLSAYAASHPYLLVPRAANANTATLDPQAPPVEFPLLIRPSDSHRGAGLALVRDAQELQEYLQAAGPVDVVLTAFVDYTSPDAYYRKYRFIFVNGRPLPYHLAISSQWMVHYFSAPMEKHKWMRDEEGAFLAAPFEVFDGERWDALLALAEVVGLDYFGVDCALLDGKVLVFEANANMLVQNFYDERLFNYKQPAFLAIAAAFNAMIRERRSLL